MANEKILIVEDEAIVAADLEQSLKRLGYVVVGVVDTGEKAIHQCDQHHPDLVLMDIRIKGEQDGIETAEQLIIHHNVPVTYLTAYADERTLERAKATLPYGYILKPFEERDLKTTIELALYKHRMQNLLDKMDSSRGNTLRSLAMGVLTTDPKGQVVYMNTRAEHILESTLTHILGQSITTIFPAKPPLPGNGSGVSFHEMSWTSPSGKTQTLFINKSPLTSEEKDQDGFVFTFFPKSM